MSPAKKYSLSIAALVAVLFSATACATMPEPTPSPSPQKSSPFLLSSPSPSPVTAASSPAASKSPTPSPSVDQAVMDNLLRDAAWADDVAGAAALIEQGADVNAKDDTIQSAYLISTSEGYLELLRLTLASDAVVNDKDSWNGTGLIRAAERGHWMVVGQLIQAGIDLDHVNRIGFQAIHEAVWLGKDNAEYATTVRVLVAAGVELDRPSGVEGLTPLAMAQQRSRALVEPTLARAADSSMVTQPDAELLAAASEGDADRVALAIRAGADLETRDTKDRTPLLLASAGDHVEAARVLVALGASPDALDDRNDTPWLVTGVTGSVAMLETLLPAHPDLGIVNRFGGTSVIPASERGHVAYVERVVTTGIDVNHVNDLGWTALMEAVILGDGGGDHQDVVRILLAAGADRAIPDADGVTALQHARTKGFTALASILEDS